MKIIKCTILLSAMSLLISFGSTVAFAGGTKADAMAACDAAETSRKAAAKVKMEWTTTGKLIKKAKGSIEAGKFEAAIKMCEKAKFQGDASVQQASIESDLWESRIPR
jgi:hypothetical protein